MNAINRFKSSMRVTDVSFNGSYKMFQEKAFFLDQRKTDHHYHWHFELIPKLSIKAGFEIATGIDICITTPEDTAKFMKEKLKI